MASENVPPPAPGSTPGLVARLGLSGKLLAIGSVAGLIAVFLPLVSMSVEMMGFVSANQSVKVVNDWRGKVCLAGYIASLVLTFALYPPNGLSQKALCWAGVSVGVLVAVLALWLLILALDVSSADMLGMGSMKGSTGIGAIVNLLAGGAVAAGAFLKAREEKLI